MAVTDGVSLKDPKAFERRLKEIKKATLVPRAELGKPKVRNLHGQRHAVEYIYQGFRELLKYRPSVGSIGLGSQRFFQPLYGRISVEFTLDTLDKDEIIRYAEGQMDSTYDQIERLNKEVDEWNERMSTTVIDKLTAMRDE